MTRPGRWLRAGRAGGVGAALGAAAMLLATLAGCASGRVAPVVAPAPGEAPMVTGQSPGSPFTDGSKEAPFSSSNSYPPGAASPPARAP